MKAAVISGPGKLEMRAIPDLPAPGEYECLCRNLYFATCTGTDLKLMHDHTPWGTTYPAVLGHEVVGEVVEVGSRVRSFSPGDLVLRPVYVFPGEEREGLHAAFGGFSEYGMVFDHAAMQEDNAPDLKAYARYQLPIPGEWRDKPWCSLFITMKETFSWLQQLGSLYGKDVAIVGTGAVGLFYTQLAALFSARSITVINRSGRGFDLACGLGADRGVKFADLDQEPQFDLLIDAAGISTHLHEFTGFIRPGGTCAVYGLDHSCSTTIEGFGSGLHFAFHSPVESDPLVHDTCVRLVERGIFPLEKFYSATMDFDRIPEGFRLLEERREWKIIFHLDQ